MEGFGPKIYDVWGIPISETVIVTWIIIAALALFAFFATRNLKQVPSKFQLFIESLVSAINNLVRQTMGEDKMKFAPYMGTIILFIGIANIIGLIGLRPPTADVNTTFALAIITFCMVQIFSVRSNGLKGYIKGFFEPMPLLFPLNVIGELANPVSLSFRLFGNIVGGLIIMKLLYSALIGLSFKIGIPIPIFAAGVPAALHIYFDLFAGLLQSFIFTMLTMVFVSMGMD